MVCGPSGLPLGADCTASAEPGLGSRLVKRGVPIYLAALALVAAQAASAQKAPEPIVSHRSAAEYAAAWRRISDDIEQRFYARKTRKWQMEELLVKYRPLALAAKDDTDFENQVEAMIHEFGDSHFDFYTRADQGYYAMDNLEDPPAAAKPPLVGAWFRQAPEGVTVQMVLEGSSAAKAGLRAGDRVLSADGAPFGPITSFLGKEGKAVDLRIQRAAREFDVSVTPVDERVLDMFLDATRTSARLIESGGKKIGYIHLWTLASDSFRNALSSVVQGRFASTDGFILDLRDGFGGRPESYADPFFRPGNVIRWDYGTSVSTEYFGYDRPLAVLINGGSRSAKEMLSYILKSAHRATLIGSTTAGNVLGTSPMRINAWSYLEMPFVDVTVDGVRLEKNGVQPDIRVADGFDKDGNDLVIERAVRFLTRR